MIDQDEIARLSLELKKLAEEGIEITKNMTEGNRLQTVQRNIEIIREMQEIHDLMVAK